MHKQRLNKLLVKLGLAESRRKADELISQSRVSIDGAICNELGFMADPNSEIMVDGKSGVRRAEIYVVYNKPKGLVCSHAKQKYPTIFDKLPKAFLSLKIAGRLDKDSQGLVILSSDGEFINQITHPSSKKDKVYKVTTKQPLNSEDLDKLNQGVKLEDGISKMRAKLTGANSLNIVMSEGKNRQIRRTLEAIGKDVIILERTKIGKYSNPSLGSGRHIFIKPEDVI